MKPQQDPQNADNTQQASKASAVPRIGYTPTEFAALFGRKVTWGYRLLYSGRVKAVTNLGRIMIPHSEAERIMSQPETYNPKPAKKAKSA
jgi:hypothetical protein